MTGEVMLSGMLLTPLFVFVPSLSKIKQRDPFMNRDCLAYIQQFKACSNANGARCKPKATRTEFSVTSELCMQVSLKFFSSVLDGQFGIK